MSKAYLFFTQYTNSYGVQIINLEQLSVKQIQELEYFVSSRNGVFNFETYSFTIQKRLDFNQFLSLITHSKIEAICKENIPIVKAQPRISFGQYKGMQYNELPDSYMLWLSNNYRGYDRDAIEKELKYRGL